jgi:hypothetical protein
LQLFIKFFNPQIEGVRKIFYGGSFPFHFAEKPLYLSLLLARKSTHNLSSRLVGGDKGRPLLNVLKWKD